MIEATLFDLDGTLVDSYIPIAQSLNFVRNHFDLESLSVNTVKKEVGWGLESLLEKNIGKENVKKGAELFRKRYEEVYLNDTTSLPGVPETLKYLDNQNIKMAVTSNKPSSYSGDILRKLELRKYFQTIYGPDMVETPKPDPEMLIKALETLNISREKALYVGDMTIDIRAGKKAGIPVWTVPTGSHTRKELKQASPEGIVTEMNGIISVIEKYNEKFG